MFCRTISWFICLFVAVVVAAEHTDPHSITCKNTTVEISLESDPQVTLPRLRTNKPESPTGEPLQEVGETTAVDVTTRAENRAPASAASGAAAASSLHSDHGGPSSDCRAAVAAASTVAPCPTLTPNDTAISLLRSLSGEEKGRRLIEAAEQGAVEELQLLLAAGADVGARDAGNGTALHWASQRGRVAAATCLLQGGAEVDARNKWQGTPLHIAAWFSRVAVVRLLVASSADPNARDQRQWTPLHWAALRGHEETVAALLDEGADKGARDDFGRTPLDTARQFNRQEVIDKLQ